VTASDPSTPTTPAHDRATAAAERIVRSMQVDERIPAVSAAIVRRDRPAWHVQVGHATATEPAESRTQFRIGSITKTFTATLVLQLRDQGLLELDDPVSAHLDLPGDVPATHRGVTVRRLLSHTSGLQREPFGNVWDTLDLPDRDRLLAELARAEAVLAPSRRWHYSNLGFALLGHLVAAKAGGTWEEVLADRLLGPLGLADTTARRREPAAQGYLVEAYTDHARPEPPIDIGGLSPAAQLWSTADDLARWMAFLAQPDPAVIAPATVEEACEPVAVTDPEQWHTGWGLGLILAPQGSGRTDRTVDVGHDGAMPGFLAGAYFRRGTAIGAAVLGSSGTARGIPAAPHRLIAASLEHDPLDVTPWTPGAPAPDALAGVLGRWWSEGFEFVFRWREGRLEARLADAPEGRPPAVFAPESADVLRTVAGRESGERLELLRDAAGTVRTMRWATYRFTRDQQTFDEGRSG
jgi:CubicO group peptidase (beta-lactamase class C family)